MKFLDTKSKITESPAGGEMVCVCGFFDPLLAAHVHMLAEKRIAGKPLAVRIVDPPDPLLPRADRARVVAALAMVDQVVLSDGVDESVADERLREAFLRDVRERVRD